MIRCDYLHFKSSKIERVRHSASPSRRVLDLEMGGKLGGMDAEQPALKSALSSFISLSVAFPFWSRWRIELRQIL
jgi:hypothetical protein